MSVVFHEGPPRGFLSTYVTTLAAYRKYVGVEGYSYKEVHISPDNFQFYGFNARNWFDILNLSDGDETSIHQNTAAIFEDYPHLDWLNLINYRKFIPYNQNTNNFLGANIRPLSNNCLGVHWRGTDHAPHGMISQDRMLSAIRERLETNEYDQVFVCSDQQNYVEIIAEFVEKEMRLNNVVFNAVMRCNEYPIFRLNVDKIALGLQVLLDSHMLSACKFILCKSSNIATYARILNLSLDGLYLDAQKYFFRR